MQLQINVQGVNEVFARIEKVDQGIQNFLKPLYKSVNYMRNEIDNNFLSKGATFQENWKKRKKEQPWPLMIKTGKLKKNWQNRIEKDKAKIYSLTDYAIFHQSGTRKMPRRVLVKISLKQQAEIFRFFTIYLNELSKK